MGEMKGSMVAIGLQIGGFCRKKAFLFAYASYRVWSKAAKNAQPLASLKPIAAFWDLAMIHLVCGERQPAPKTNHSVWQRSTPKIQPTKRGLL